MEQNLSLFDQQKSCPGKISARRSPCLLESVSLLLVEGGLHCCSKYSTVSCFGQRPWLAKAYLKASTYFARGMPTSEGLWKGVSSI